MATSRPRTPTVISDTYSDPDSLSDLESGWTDLSSNRSNGRRTPSIASDIDDSEDAASLIDRFDEEVWEGLAPEVGDSAMNENSPVDPRVSATAAVPVQSPSPKISTVSLTPEEEEAVDVLGNSEADSLSGSAQHLSVRGSSATIRLSFPDPLSDSREELLPSHATSRKQHRAVDLPPVVDEPIATRAAPSPEIVNVQPLPDAPSSSFDHNVVDDTKSDDNTDIIPLKSPTSSYTPTLVIALAGYSPLPHLKDSIMSTVFNMVASVLDGSPIIPEEKDVTCLYSVPVYSRASMKQGNNSSTPIHHIFVSDNTTGSFMSSSFGTWDCPTLTLVFIQPPFHTSPLPHPPANTKYLPLLLPSISDEASSSLLDLSPSVLFDHSVPNISVPDHTWRRQFAAHQCDNLHIGEKRLDGMHDVLNVDEFLALPPHKLSPALGDLVFGRKSKEASINNRFGPMTSRKPIVFISAFLVALLFGFTVLTRDPLPLPPSPTTPTRMVSDDQKSWSFLHPLVHNVPSSAPLPTVSNSIETSETPVVRSRALSPASLKSFAVSVFLPEVKVNDDAAADPSTKSSQESEKYTAPPSHEVKGHEQTHHPALDAAIRPLTLDPPVTKSISLLHFPSQSSVKGKEKAIDESPEADLLKAFTTVSTRISHALAPLFDSMSNDLRELIEAIDILLRSVMQLQDVASQRMNGLVQTVTKQASQVQEFASKVYSAAQIVGEQASYRHDRAKDNARKMRDAGGRYVSAVKETFGSSFERARGNAKTVLKEGIAFGKHSTNTVYEARRIRREARAARKLIRKEARRDRLGKHAKKQGGFCSFYSVLGLVV